MRKMQTGRRFSEGIGKGVTMEKGYINWKLAIVLVVATCVCVGAGWVLHDWQKSTRAEQARPLGIKAYDQENWPEAAEQLGHYLAVNQNDVDILLKYGHAQRQIRPLMPNNVDQAISTYSTVLRSDTATPEEVYQATRWLVEMCLIRGRFTEAETQARNYLASHDDTVVQELLGQALFRQRKFQEAAETFESLIEKHPQEVGAYDLLGRFANERPDDISEPPQYWYDKMLSANPDSALAHIQYGKFLLGQKEDPNRVDHALKEFERAENLDLSDTSDRLKLINALIAVRQLDRDREHILDKAREHIQVVKTETPKDSLLWSYWAKVAILSGAPEEMKAVAEAGLKELTAQPWEFMLWATELLIRTDQFEKAKDCIIQLQKKDVEVFRPRVHFLEGLLAQWQEKWEEAVTAWEKAIALGYQSPSDLYWYGQAPPVRLVLADAQVRSGNISQAIAQLRTQISEAPKYIEARLGLARLLAIKGDWAEVLVQTREVQRDFPKNTEAMQLEIQARIQLQGRMESPTTAQEGTWKDIEDRIAQLGENTDHSLNTMILKARAAIIRQKYDEAVAILDEIEKDHPDSLEPILLRSQLYVHQENIEAAITLLEGAMERFPQNVRLVSRVSTLLNYQGEQLRCESMLKAAIERMEQPEDRKTLGLQLAEWYNAWKKSDLHYEWSMELTQQFPNDISVKRNLLAVNRILSDSKRAQKIVDEIKTIEGQDGYEWRIEQVHVWLNSPDFRSHYAEAVRLLQENLLSDPDDQASRRYLAMTYEKGDEKQLAVMIWKEALDRSERNSPDYAQTLVQTISALYRAGQNDEAGRLLARAEQEDIQHPDLQRLKVEGQLRDQEWSSASDLLLEMVHEDPNNLNANLELARTYAQQGMFEEAHAVLDTFIAKNPRAIAAKVLKVDLFISQDNAEGALNICNVFLENEGTDIAHLLRAQTYDKLGRPDEALNDYNRAVSLSPEKAGTWTARALFRLNRGQIKEGVEDIQKSLELVPNSPEVQATAAKLFLASGDDQLIERGQALLERAIQANARDIDLRVLKARMLIAKRTPSSIEEARTLLKGMTRESSSPLKAWEWLVRLEGDYGETRDAIQIASQGLSRYPNQPMLLSLKALAQTKEDPAEAITTLTLLLDQNPNNITVIRQLADAYDKAQRPQEALKLLQERLPALTGQARRSCELMLATILYRSGAIDQASAAFNRLIEDDPNDPLPVLTWAQWLGRGQRYDQTAALVEQWRARHPSDTVIPTAIAEALLATHEPEALQRAEELTRKTLRSNPDYVPALRVLAGVKVQSSRPEDQEESAALNRKILEIDPNNVVSINNLAWFLCEAKGQYQAALDLVNKGIKIAPKYSDILDTRAVIHYRMHHYEEAERDLARCISLCRPDASSLPTTRLHLAKVYVELGRKTEAMQQLRQALEVQDQTRKADPPEILPMSDADEAEAKQLLEQLRKGS